MSVIYSFWCKPFRNSYRSYKNWKNKNIQLQQTLENIHNQVVAKKYLIRKLMFDFDFRERFIREKKGYLEPNERVVFFKTQEAVESQSEKLLQNN